jgi:hypothetical protein
MSSKQDSTVVVDLSIKFLVHKLLAIYRMK